jgi:hypothetical protein
MLINETQSLQKQLALIRNNTALCTDVSSGLMGFALTEGGLTMDDKDTNVPNKTDYISREAAKTLIHDRAIEMALNNVGFKADASDILEHISKRSKDWIDEVPAADVRPVVRGKWIEVSRPTQSKKAAICECSVCGDTIWVYDGQREWKYCPNCGADMREAVEIDQVKEGAE